MDWLEGGNRIAKDCLEIILAAANSGPWSWHGWWGNISPVRYRVTHVLQVNCFEGRRFGDVRFFLWRLFEEPNSFTAARVSNGCSIDIDISTNSHPGLGYIRHSLSHNFDISLNSVHNPSISRCQGKEELWRRSVFIHGLLIDNFSTD